MNSHATDGTGRARRIGRSAAIAAMAMMAACAGRRAPLPVVVGELADVIVRASFADDAAATDGAVIEPLLLDSLSFLQLGVVAGAAAYTAGELQRQVTRPFRLVDRRDVLQCPRREPCRTAGNSVYIEVWEAEPTRSGMDVVVSRVFNVQGLQVMTRSETHRLTIAREAGGWRLTGRDRLPD